MTGLRVLKRIVSLSVCSAMILSVNISMNNIVHAYGIDDIKDSFVGVVGCFTDWIGDTELTNPDKDGIYDAIIDLESVKSEWLSDWYKDDKPTGEKHIQFKIRLNNDWQYNWGNYEPEHDRVFDSQCNLAIIENVQPGDHIRFRVFF